MSMLAFSLIATVTPVMGPTIQERPWDWGPGMHPMWWMWGAGGILMMVMMLVFWGAVLAAVVFLVRWLAGQGRTDRTDPALQVLRERYARGEISREEFEARKRDLTTP